MDLVLSQNSDKPIYTQIYEQISSQILNGTITAETKLPPIRTVALNLRISVIPVKQAWERLEREGFIVTAAGRGTYVRNMEAHQIEKCRMETAGELLQKDVSACREMGLSLESIIEIVKNSF